MIQLLPKMVFLDAGKDGVSIMTTISSVKYKLNLLTLIHGHGTLLIQQLLMESDSNFVRFNFQSNKLKQTGKK